MADMLKNETPGDKANAPLPDGYKWGKDGILYVISKVLSFVQLSGRRDAETGETIWSETPMYQVSSSPVPEDEIAAVLARGKEEK